MKLYEYLTDLLAVVGGITVFLLCFSDQWYGWVARIYLGVLLVAYLINQEAIEARDYEKMGALERFEYTMRKNRQ